MIVMNKGELDIGWSSLSVPQKERIARKGLTKAAGGDVDEDEYDSKVSCTELTILKQLSRKDFFMFALAYMCDHPLEKWNKRVNKEHGIAENGFAVVRGIDPRAKGKRGDILALAKESPDGSKILQIGLATVDGKSILANTWYGVDLKKRRFASQSQCA